MQKDQPPPTTIDDYIAGFPPNIQTILQKIRLTIRNIAPDAKEAIKYLIQKIVEFRVTETLEKETAKKKKKR